MFDESGNRTADTSHPGKNGSPTDVCSRLYRTVNGESLKCWKPWQTKNCDNNPLHFHIQENNKDTDVRKRAKNVFTSFFCCFTLDEKRRVRRDCSKPFPTYRKRLNGCTSSRVRCPVRRNSERDAASACAAPMQPSAARRRCLSCIRWGKGTA